MGKSGTKKFILCISPLSVYLALNILQSGKADSRKILLGKMAAQYTRRLLQKGGEQRRRRHPKRPGGTVGPALVLSPRCK